MSAQQYGVIRKVHEKRLDSIVTTLTAANIGIIKLSMIIAARCNVLALTLFQPVPVARFHGTRVLVNRK
jgi:hypothetical protein